MGFWKEGEVYIYPKIYHSIKLNRDEDQKAHFKHASAHLWSYNRDTERNSILELRHLTPKMRDESRCVR